MDQLRTVIQRRVFDFLHTRWGITLVIILTFWCLNTLLQIVQLLISTGNVVPAPSCMHCCQHNYANNLVQKSFESRLCHAPMDIVYTWVNGSDPKLQKDVAYWKPIFMAKYGLEEEIELDAVLPSDYLNVTNETNYSNYSNYSSLFNMTSVNLNASNTNDAELKTGTMNRFRDNDELRYSLRSLWKFSPWIRHVYIVTNGQIPNWININHPRLTIVPHSDIFPNKSHLPCFSSPAIESHLHRIPGLSDKFIYLNDDVMFGNKIWPDDFFTYTMGQKIFLSWDVPQCKNGCPDTWIGDNYCDSACNFSECSWDGGDCDPSKKAAADNTDTNANQNNNVVQGTSPPTYDNYQYCAIGCPYSWVGDKVCDRACKNQDCVFDGGDCGLELIQQNLFGVNLTNATKIIEIDSTLNAIYFDLRHVLPQSITEASHDTTDVIRSAIITQRLHLLTLILSRSVPVSLTATPAPNSTDINETETKAINFFLAGEINGSRVEISFNIVRKEHERTDLKNETKNETLSPTSGTARRVLTSIDEDISNKNLNWYLKQLSELVENVYAEGIKYDNSSQMIFRSSHERSQNFEESAALTTQKNQKQWIQKQEEKIRYLLRKIIKEKQREKKEKYNFEPVWPWEMLQYIQKMDTSFKPNDASPASRKLMMDTFGDSLRFVNKLLNDEFGHEARKVPAHMPHCIDKNIMADLQARWPHEFDQTSQHRFRHPDDMQYSFSYFYFYMHSKEEFDPYEFFETVDTDQNAVWDWAEVEFVSLLLSGGKPVPTEEIDELENKLRNCSLEFEIPDGAITVDALIQCPEPLGRLVTMVNQRFLYQHEKVELDQVDFYMIRNDWESVQTRLNEIRAKGPKFICLNDDMNKTHTPDPRLLEVLEDYYTGYFPYPSPFELPDGQLNEFLYITDLRTAEVERWWSRVIFLIPFCLLCIACIPTKIRSVLLYGTCNSIRNLCKSCCKSCCKSSVR